MVGVVAGAYGWLRGPYAGGGAHTPVEGAHMPAYGAHTLVGGAHTPALGAHTLVGGAHTAG
jgi:hypothetical protein